MVHWVLGLLCCWITVTPTPFTAWYKHLARADIASSTRFNAKLNFQYIWRHDKPFRNYTWPFSSCCKMQSTNHNGWLVSRRPTSGVCLLRWYFVRYCNAFHFIICLIRILYQLWSGRRGGDSSRSVLDGSRNIFNLDGLGKSCGRSVHDRTPTLRYELKNINLLKIL